jgi:CHAT domain-containing protein
MSKGSFGAEARTNKDQGGRDVRRAPVAAAGALLSASIAWFSGANCALAGDPVEPYRSAREAYLTAFRVSGARDPATPAKLERELRAIVAQTGGETQARALFELGSDQRLANDFPAAVLTLSNAASTATTAGRSDVAFDSWIGVARAHVLGDHDHGAAETAIDSAIVVSGPRPSAKQRYEIARYYAESLVARGEIGAGLVSALDAVDVAPAADDRFYGELDAGDAIEKLANSCDYRPMWDDRSEDDPPDDPWGACRRAVAATRAAYERAALTADGLGWKFLADNARNFEHALDTRSWLIEQRAKSGARNSDFAPKDAKDVLVLKGETARQTLLADRKGAAASRPDLAREIEQTLAEADKAPGGANSPSSLYLRGVLLEMRGADVNQAAALFAKAAADLAAQRAGFFDPLRRGTVIESNGEIFRDLALRLLALNRDADAFGALESARARGLSEMEWALAQKDVAATDRAELAELLRLEAESSAAETRIVEQVVGEGKIAPSAADLSRWRMAEAERRAYLSSHENLRNRFAQTKFSPANLANLEAATTRTGIPVLLYWVATPNVVIWYVGPHGSDVRVVFLPEIRLTQKVSQLVGSIDERGKTFDEKAARELYLYLIAPFDDLLDGNEVIIVPQGPIVGLPFEALIEPTSGAFLIDRRIVSYAPNASMAFEALSRDAPVIKEVTAVVDPELSYTGEREKIASVAGLRVKTIDASEVLPDRLSEAVAGAESAHILLHGNFDVKEPLRSSLADTSHRSQPLLATSLLSLPLKGMKLVVLSACESGRVEVRISNEIYGFPWVLLAGGVENVVTSRWVVDGGSNGAWMKFFYSALAKGASPAESAATAMRAMRASGEANPYSWAAMQVNGR